MFNRSCELITLVRWSFDQQCRCLVKLCSSQFQDIIDDVGVASQHYKGRAGYPLSVLSGHRRGTILQQFCRKQLAEMYPRSMIQDAVPGISGNGRRRARHQSEYGFSFDQRRIECKSSLMQWNKKRQNWLVSFSGIKLPWADVRVQAPFDDLYLMMVSPNHLDIIKHDLKTFVATNGKSTLSIGHQIRIHASRKQRCWKAARAQILDKLLSRESSCSAVAHLEFSNPGIQSWLSQSLRRAAAPQDEAYLGTPLGSMSSSLRGKRIEQIAYKVDQILHPGSIFSTGHSVVDWVRDGLGVEVKHGQMIYDKKETRWRCNFSGIKCAFDHVREQDSFDELWLVVYSPRGLHFFKHPGRNNGYVEAGLRTDSFGHCMLIRAPRGSFDFAAALEAVMQKIKDIGCQLFVEVLWTNRGFVTKGFPSPEFGSPDEPPTNLWTRRTQHGASPATARSTFEEGIVHSDHAPVGKG